MPTPIKLSDSVKAGLDLSPWVLDEIKKLEKQAEEAYGRGVAAGKKEAAGYTAEERERYGMYATAGEFYLELKAKHDELKDFVRHVFGSTLNELELIPDTGVIAGEFSGREVHEAVRLLKGELK